MKLNKEFRIVFQPKNPEIYGKRRFCVGAYSLHKYIGVKNSNTAIISALKSKEQRYTKKFRKYGRIDFYVK